MPEDGWAVSAVIEKRMGKNSAGTLGAKAVDGAILKVIAAVADQEDRTSTSVWNRVGDNTSCPEQVMKRRIVKFKSLLLRRNKWEMPTALKTVAPGRQIDKKARDWQSAVDPNSGETYYFHRFTRETTWEMPAGFMKVTN
jgi:hypothetical protein